MPVTKTSPRTFLVETGHCFTVYDRMIEFGAETLMGAKLQHFLLDSVALVLFGLMLI